MKQRAICIYMLAIIVILVSAVVASAADKMLDATVDSVTVALDKNQNEYVRMIITETRSLNGVQYKTGVPVMAFGDLVDKAKAMQAGDKLTAIAGYSASYDSYTIKAFINQ